MLRWLAALFGVGLMAIMVAGWQAHQRLQPVSPSENAPLQLFEVERGMGLGQAARALERAGLIRDWRALRLLAEWRGDTGRLMAGEYELSPSWSTHTILDRIISGRVKTYEVVIPEGMRATEIAARLAEAGLVNTQAFLALVNDAAFANSLGIEGNGLEGYLYPETYRIARNLDTSDVARILVDQFEDVWSEIEPLTEGQELSKHEIVTLASIVEKETAAPEERPLIAAVFLNRLKKGMRLETDPTVIYGIADFDGNIKKQHLQDASNPYNTYRIKGLPPGPIANPGIDALRAVLEPSESDYLFFVSRNDGTHHFSRSYREHVNAVNRYQLRRGRR